MNEYTESGTSASPAAPGQKEGQEPDTGRTPGQLSHEQILDATAACLKEYGYDGTTIRRIAAKLGCAVGSIYRYCSDKRTLLSQVAQRYYEPVLGAIEDHQPLERGVAMYADAARQDPQQYHLMFWLASLGNGAHPSRPLPLVVARIIDGWSRQMGDPRLAQRLWAQLHGAITLGLPTETLLSDLYDLIQSSPGRRAGQAAAPREQQAEESATPASPQQPRTGEGITVTSRNREDLTLL